MADYIKLGLQDEDTLTAEHIAHIEDGVSTLQNQQDNFEKSASERLDTLEAGYRHIATITNDSGEDVTQIDITADSKGNAFACSDFLMFLTLPTSDDVADDIKTQLYIGHKMYNWEVFIRGGFSISRTRWMRLHIYHAFDGYWVTDGVFSDKTDGVQYAAYGDTAPTPTTFGNIKSMTATGPTISELHFLTVAPIPNGTKIEIYGKDA